LLKDNSTFREKAALRRRALGWIDDPVVLETHGGAGKLYRAVYAHVAQGAVFEQDERKAEVLAGQRPTWAVYQGDCVAALADGAAGWLPANILDLDPYGEPWPALRAFFQSERPRPGRMVVVVNDGLRQKVRAGGAWSVGSLARVVQRFGNDLHDRYLEACHWLVTEEVRPAGYAVTHFEGYYCGHNQQMTHYLAVLACI
jgi:hypothetical protein